MAREELVVSHPMNQTDPNQKMKKLVIAGTYAEYRQWRDLHNAHERAAPFIQRGEQLAGLDPAQVEIVLVGSYAQNEAYCSPQYWELKFRIEALQESA